MRAAGPSVLRRHALEGVLNAPPITGPITFASDRFPVFELDLGPSPPPGLPEATISYLKAQLGPAQPLPSLIRRRNCPVLIQVRLSPTAAGYGAASRLLSHSGSLSAPFNGGTHIVGVQSVPALLPPDCVCLQLHNVPGHLGSVVLPRVVLELAGYTVEEAGAGEPPAPRPGVVVICQIRPGILKGGAGYHAGSIIAMIIPPLGDPWLQHLPPHLLAEGLEGQCVHTFIKDDPLARAAAPPIADRPPPAPAAAACAGGPGHLPSVVGNAAAGAQPPLAAPLPPNASGAPPGAVGAAEPSGSPSQGQPPGQGLGSEAGGSGGLAPTHRAPGSHDGPSHAPGGSAAPTPGGSPSSPHLVPSGSPGQGFGVEAGGDHGGAPPPRAPGVQELALSAPGGPAAMPSGSSPPAALPPCTSLPATSGMASPPHPMPHAPVLPAPPDNCPLCLEPLPGPTGMATTPCGHHFCTQCLVTQAAVSSDPETYGCPLCRATVGTPLREAHAMFSPEMDQARAEFEERVERDHFELARALAESFEDAYPLSALSLSPPSSPTSRSIGAGSFHMPPEPSAPLVPSSAPGVSAPHLAASQLQHAPGVSAPHPAAPQLQHAPGGSAPRLAALASPQPQPTPAPSGSVGPWRRRSERENLGQRGQPYWISNPAARVSEDGSHSGSSSPPQSAASAGALASHGYALRPRQPVAWGSGIQRTITWGSALSQRPSRSPPPPSQFRDGRGRW